MSAPRPAVVTVVAGRHEHLLRQRRALRAWHAATPHHVVAMGDPVVATLLHDDPGVVVHELPGVAGAPLPLAAARNLGAAAALEGGADLLVGLDVDCLPGPDLVDRYAAAAAATGDSSADDVLLCGPVTYLDRGAQLGALGRSGGDTRADAAAVVALARLRRPHAARPDPPAGCVERGEDPDLFWSLSFAATSRTWERVGGFDPGYTGYGGEDTDLGWRARERGVPIGWVGGADAFHQWHPVSSPPVEHLDDVLRNAAAFHARWGAWPMRGWLEGFAALGLVRHVDDRWVRTVPTARP